MEITVHRGSNEIGGTCIEIEHNKCRIILDLGIPLTQTGGGEFDAKILNKPSVANGMLPDISGLYSDAPRTIDAVLLSHAHMDHYGLMDFIHPDIPVYLSNDAKAIIEVGNIFWGEKMQQKNLLNHCKTFAYWDKFKIGPFTITPYLVDHSAFGSTAFLIENDGKKVFYTGDFRAHGNKPATYQKLLKDKNLKGVDALLIEGTTLGGGHKGSLASEADVDTQMTDVFKQQQDVSFVIASGSNIDRLVTLFKATKRADKELVIDLYQYYLLCKLKAANPNSKMPPFDDDHIRIFYTSSQAKKIADNLGVKILYQFKKKKISREEIIERRQDLVLRLSLFEMERLANKMNDVSPLDEAVLIYSMWSGYLKKDTSFNDFCSKFNIPMKHIHSSGHAYKDDLLKLVNAIQPKKLIPIHTLHAEVFKEELPILNVIIDKIIDLK
jgi:ribonuclease J